jgi:hypothetical protein
MNIFVLATIVSIVYFIIKFIEMIHIEKESKPLKYLIRDCLVVYISVICAYYIFEQIKPMMNMSEGGGPVATQVFTDNPEF